MKKILILGLCSSVSLWGCQQGASGVVTPVPAPSRPAVASPAPPTATPSPNLSIPTSPTVPVPTATPTGTATPPPQPTVAPPTQPVPSPTPEPAQPLMTTINARYVGQIFYQLDCIAGQSNCSRAAYQNLWNTLGYQDSDQAQIQAWQALRSDLDITQVNGPTLPNLAEPLLFQNSNRWQSVRVAALTSDTLSAFEQKLVVTVSADEARALRNILQHFSDRFLRRWWEQGARAESEALLQRYRESFASYNLDDEIEKISAFYGVTHRQEGLHFHLLLQAPGAEDLSLAEQILNHGVIEISSAQSPRSQLDVMIHEMTHYFFKQLPPETQASIQGFFAQQPDPFAMSAFHLLDETLATAIGNGYLNARLLDPAFFAQMQATPLSFFNDTFIDSNAKALYQSGDFLANQVLDSSAFLARYYAIAQNAIALDHPIPGLRLSAVYAATDSLKGLLPDFQARLKPWGQFVVGESSGPRFLARYPRLNGVLLIGTDLTPLNNWREVLGESAYQEIMSRSNQDFIYSVKGKQRQIYVIRGRTLSTAESLLQQLLDP